MEGAAAVNKVRDTSPSTIDPDDSASSLSAGSADPRCRRSSPLLSVLLASVGDHRDDDVNAQSILEDHLLRVWDETTCNSVPCRCRSLHDDAVDTTDSRRA